MAKHIIKHLVAHYSNFLKPNIQEKICQIISDGDAKYKKIEKFTMAKFLETI